VGALSRREPAQRVALVPQSPSTPPELTVSEYVLLGRTPYIAYLASEGASDASAAAVALGRLGLGDFVGRRLSSLSGGELQRVVLARALAQEAPLLLLDEPTSALDLGRQQQVLEQVDELRRAHGLTVVSAMHDLSLASQFADRLVLLDRGTVVAEGEPRDVISESTIADLYGAHVRVLHDGGEVFVLPRRREAV
jgi:iron complex transport system ATP-binding protein